MNSLTTDRVKLGFIGLGSMGSRIAQRLLDHRYRLFVYDRNPEASEALVAQGATLAAQAIARHCHNRNNRACAVSGRVVCVHNT